MIITWIIIGFIICGFIWFVKELIQIEISNRHISSSLKNGDAVHSLQNTKLGELTDAYKQSFNRNIADGNKTNVPSANYFNIENVSNAYSFNLRMLDAASGILVGLGLFGTFLGLTLGIKGFDSSDTNNIQQSIQSLLGGMSTAFYTSLFGMGTSLLYTIAEKIVKKRLQRTLHTFTEKLDSIYYIDDNVLQEEFQVALVNKVIKAIQKELNTQLTYTNESDENISIGNAIREILKENTEQSKALKSFSTDLAIELNNGFDEVLSRQMQERILPLMESVDATTKSVVEHIDQMAVNVASPASDLIESVVSELKNSMAAIIDEFKNNLSGSATSQLETLAMQLGTASQTMGDFPKSMANISTTLQVTIDEVKNAIAEISKTSANANSTAMQQMQEQIAFATGSISSAITEVKEVMNGITQSTQEQSNQMIAKLSDAAEKMGTFLENTVVNLSSSVQSSMKSITDNISNTQTDLMALQEDTTEQTKKLLELFNEGLDRMEKMNEYVVGTMNGFKQAQGEISISTGNLRTISSDMKLAMELFNKSQTDYTEKLTQLQLSSQKGIGQIEELLINSGQMSEEYAQKFEIIKQSLSEIFAKLQAGLTEYSRTVQASTQKYLDQYSTSLTQTTDALASAIQQQNEVVEMLNETLSKRR